MVTYDQIMKANEGLTGIDVKGKNYVMVPERVKAFRKLYPEGFIKTDILSMENGVCVMKTKVGYYDNGHEIILGSGLAYEKESNGYINKTSYIENCETSSVGRALGFLALGIDGGGICSAEELMNAVNNQRNDTVTIPANNRVPDRQNTNSEVKAADNLNDLRMKLDVAIKEKTKDMSRNDKILFVNTIIMPILQGQRNWKLCDDPELLSALLKYITEEAA